MSDKIQRIYNRTKFQDASPKDLDDLILEKMRTLDNKPQPIWYKKSEVYIPIAASILLLAIFQPSRVEKTDQMPIEIVKTLPDNKPTTPVINANRNKLPDIFLKPQKDISNKVVPACTGNLVVPEVKMDLIEKNTADKSKRSNLPMKPIYPYDKTKSSPNCDSVSSQILKNN